MKMVKSLILGSAAGLVAIAGAQAADLPVKAKPVQYVKICSLYGAGFYYIPGTDTCIKLGGFVRAEAQINGSGSMNPYRSQNFNNPSRSYENTRTRVAVTLDTRSQTEYGTLRSYLMVGAQQSNGNDPNSFNGEVAPGGNPYALDYSTVAFVQWAGFTAGSTSSFFELDQDPYANDTHYISSNQSGAGIFVFAYTAQLGNGLSASISAEDPQSRQSSILDGNYAAPALYTSPGVSGYGGRKWPDIVANLRVDQAWGSAQVMGAIHDVYANNSSATVAQTYDATGYAFGAGAKFNLPMLGKGDYFITQYTYSKGATNYVAQNSGFGGLAAFALTNGFPVTAASTSAIAPVVDAVVTSAANVAATGTGMDLTTAWGATAGYEHFWSTMWKTSLWGDYGQFRYSAAASATIAAAAPGYALTTVGNGSANSAVWQLGSRTTWTPVENLDLAVDVIYSDVHGAFVGGLSPTLGTLVADKGFWSGQFRVQRNFWP